MHVAFIATVFAIIALSQAIASDYDVLSARAATVYCPLRKNPGAVNICREAGQLSAPDQIDVDTNGPGYPTVSSSCMTAEQCNEKCKAYYYQYDLSSCKSFSFDTAAKSCKFYNSTLNEQGFTHSASSTTTFSDSSCFKCSSCAPNLLNGDWETGNTSPWIVFFPDDSGIAKGYKSRSSISFAGHGKTSVNGVEQHVRMCANTEYNLDFDYRYTVENGDTHGAGHLQLTIYPLDGSSGGLSKQIFLRHVQPDVWHHASVPLSPGPSTRYSVGMYAGLNANNVSTTYYYDNIVFSLAS